MIHAKVLASDFWQACIKPISRFLSGKSYCEDSDIIKSHPLKNIRVLDMTRIVAGPFCTMILADMGAEVIKIERPNNGDESRKWGPPFLPKSKDSTYFLACNRNKKSVCVDIQRGSEIIRDLSRKCDVFVENYVPGKLAKYRLDYEHLKQFAPHLIYCSVTGYGPHGPYANRPGYDVIAASLGGLLHITGEQSGPPCKVGVAVTDLATGLFAHGSILAALLQREKTGRGQKIDVNLLSTQLTLLINVASSYLNGGVTPQRWGTAHANIVPYQAFKTIDGYITICAGSDDQFKALCKLLSIDELSADEKYKTNQNRVANRVELINKLSSIFMTDSTANWMKLFDNSPFPYSCVNNIKEVFNDSHVKDIGLVKTLQHSKDGPVRVVGPPVVFSESLNDARTAPPVLGQHTEEILREILDYSSKKIDNLRSNKIIN